MRVSYTIEEHKHRFAFWVAGRAASVKGYRFSVHQAKAILEAVGFDTTCSNPLKLPSPTQTDRMHREWRNAVIRAAKQQGLTFTDGVAAKLINSYLKVRFVCAGMHAHARVKCLHPPIDALLLDELAEKNVGGFRSDWTRLHNAGWSNFDSQQYEEVVGLIRRSLPGRPLWEVEKYWRGHQ